MTGAAQGQTIQVGRDPANCEVVIKDAEVSRKHCRITLSPEGKVIVVDLGSANGTLLNGEAMEANVEVVVAPGDKVGIGGATMIAEPEPEPEPEPAVPRSTPSHSAAASPALGPVRGEGKRRGRRG